MENINKIDKSIRLNIGTHLVNVSYDKKVPVKILGYIGIGLIITSVSGFSPVYYLVSKKFNKIKNNMEKQSQ